MNIIKFIDKEAKETDGTYTELDTLYNKYFRGRYCWAINFTKCYCIKPDADSTIPGVLPGDYAAYERGDKTDIPVDADGVEVVIDYDDFKGYIDIDKSLTKVSTEYFTTYNKFIDDLGDICMCLLRRYRAQVAAFIYNGIQGKWLDLCDKKRLMLEYYIYDMNDDTVSELRIFDAKTSTDSSSCGCGCNKSIPTATQVVTSCGCSSNGTTTLTNLLNNTVNCDLVEMYRKKMKAYMVETFSDPDFWGYVSVKYKAAISNIIKYTELLIESGLSIYSTDVKFDLNYSCADASSSQDSRYMKFVYDLNQILTAFRLIEQCDFSKMSFIRSALSTFAEYYEYMQWDDSGNIELPGIDTWKEYKR